MRRHFCPWPAGRDRLVGYLLTAAIVLGSLTIVPQAWATPDQMRDNQTVPTRTPKPPEPTAPPTEAPRPTAEPQTPAPPTPAPTATATDRPAALSLALSADPILVWSGVTVVYTLTAVNRSPVALGEVVLLAQLPAELQPGAIFAPPGVSWDGGALRIRLAELAAGAQAQVVFAARVASGVSAGKVILTQASAAAAGGAAVNAAAVVAMPPAELPAVGRDADRAR